MKRLLETLRGFNITFLLTVILFLLIAFILSTTAGIVWLFIDKEWLNASFLLSPLPAATLLYIICTLLAISILVVIRVLILKPIQYMIKDMEQLAAGDFSVRMEETEKIRPKELRQFVKAFNTTAEELGSVELLRRDFVNNFAHEFKTPITSLAGFADLILEDEQMSVPERQECLEIISKEAHRLTALSNNILALSRIDSQPIGKDIANFHLTEQLRQTILLLEQKWNAKHLDIQFDVEECYYVGNEAMLKEVWVNLLDNAIKFSKEKGVIKVMLKKNNENIYVSIQDFGVGMDENTKSHIFDQFYQGDTSHKTEGNGLGLALVEKIVKLHNGKIIVKSKLGSGSTFTIIFPYV